MQTKKTGKKLKEKFKRVRKGSRSKKEEDEEKISE